MSEEEVKRLRNRVSRLEDQIEHVYSQRIEEQQQRIDELEDTVQTLAGDVEVVDERVDGIIDVDSDDVSDPPKRAVALREAMIRASGDDAGSFSGGVTWWWKEVRDQLATHGHGSFSKPVYHTAMDDAAEKDGFALTTKEVITGGQRREVNAISLNPEEVTSPSLRNQLTTRPGVEASQDSAATDGGTMKTDD